MRQVAKMIRLYRNTDCQQPFNAMTVITEVSEGKLISVVGCSFSLLITQMTIADVTQNYCYSTLNYILCGLSGRENSK